MVGSKTSSGAETSALARRLGDVLLRIVSEVPSSRRTAAAAPRDRARVLALKASAHAAVASGTLALPPGPIGIVTILPDLLAVWKIQRQLVSDIAAVYGQTSRLGREQMIYCLFRHAAGQAVRDLVGRVGERWLVRPATLRAIQRILRRVGVAVTRRAASRAVSRVVPLVGAVGIGAYAFYDTAHVGKTAIAFFEREIVPGGYVGRS